MAQSAVTVRGALNPKISPQNCVSLGWWRKASRGSKMTATNIYWEVCTRLRTLHRIVQLVPLQHYRECPILP